MATRKSTGAAKKAAPLFKMKPLGKADLWDMVRLIGKIGITTVFDAIPKDLSKAADFHPPMMMNDKGEAVPMPRDKWTDAQQEAETQAVIANNKISLAVSGTVLQNLGTCEAEVDSLLARSIGKTPEEFNAMFDEDITGYVKLIDQFVTREGFTDFFMEAFKLLQDTAKSPTFSSAGTVVQSMRS